MDIIDMRSFGEPQLLQAAEVLSAGLPEWLPTPQDARKEVAALPAPGNTMLAAVHEGECRAWAASSPPSMAAGI